MILGHIFINTKVRVTFSASITRGPAAQTLVPEFIEKFSLDIHDSRARTMLFALPYSVHLISLRL